ncbi:NUDIX hydrolase [Flavobacterium akiainvivens]|uniref:NUDIX hydrolase n=1 Tax=Flavobacterium akiainvivens TaxID=1202724 RepID=A0A0M9VI35_9FLAO|nr:NUDIX domain-containing protein [Flavobacterium akiainvivens]KOS06236.1 NUDIX hydrolase [Flavobacterium akiainvivens]SFQ18207.1 Predicted NTP pyrophosphohydrolase, NUDIX family [Flavobacterium akiainvivens]
MKQSAGILLYRLMGGAPEFFLVHPGGPFFAKKNEGWWTIPKGEPAEDEALLATAIREFEEETGYTPQEPFTELEPITQKGGKKVFAWACMGNLEAGAIISNTFEMAWPPKSGKTGVFPEVDKAGWFGLEEAKTLINERQAAFLDELAVLLKK